jgi:oligopeptide/dipeptide ABC transporter ATP-binding protein
MESQESGIRNQKSEVKNPESGIRNPELKVMPLLKIQGLCKNFSSGNLRKKRVRVIDSVDMDVHAGEIRGIVGESGSGKTTLARCIMRLIEPSSGMVQFDGWDLASLRPAALRAKRKEFQMIFQDSFASLNPGMTVGQVLSEPLKIHAIGTGDFRDRRIRELLESVSLSTSLIHRKSSELSGGQQQRLGIARGLALKPRLLIADEPVSALDPSVQAQILNLLGDLKRQHNLSLILISHSLHAVHYLCTHVSVLYKGRLVEEAPAPGFFREPKHPYSRILLESMPVLEPFKKNRASASPNMDPSSASALSGCTFYAHCPHRLPLCTEQFPPLSEISPGEKVACFLYAHKHGL